MKAEWLLVFACAGGVVFSCGEPFGEALPATPALSDDGGGEIDGGEGGSSSELAMTLQTTDLVLHAGKTVDVVVNMTGIADGHSFEITFDGLPAGVAADPPVFAQNQARATLRAKSDAKQGLASVKVNAVEHGGKRATSALNLDVMGLPGTIDDSFGTGSSGAVMPSVDGRVTDLSMLPDGRIATLISSTDPVARTFFVSQLTRNGRADTTFGTQGTANKRVGTGLDSPSNIVRQPDGKLLAFGTADVDFVAGTDQVVLRFEPNGMLESSFGSAGIAHAVLGDSVSANVAVGVRQADGKIVIVSNREKFNLVYRRFDARGLLEAAPDYVPFGGPTDLFEWRACESLPDKSLVVAGENTNTDTGKQYGLLVKLNQAGEYSPGAGSTPNPVWVEEDTTLQAMARQADGKLVVVGRKTTTKKAVINRVTAEGIADVTFGAGGRTYLPFGGGADSEATAVGIDGAGRVVVAGVLRGAVDQIFVVRLESDGGPDLSFGAGGTFLVPLVGNLSNRVRVLRFAVDGRIVLGAEQATGVSSLAPLVLRINP